MICEGQCEIATEWERAQGAEESQLRRGELTIGADEFLSKISILERDIAHMSNTVSTSLGRCSQATDCDYCIESAERSTASSAASALFAIRNDEECGDTP